MKGVLLRSLTCPNRGTAMKRIASFTEPRSIGTFLQHTGLSPPKKSFPSPSPNDVMSR